MALIAGVDVPPRDRDVLQRWGAVAVNACWDGDAGADRAGCRGRLDQDHDDAALMPVGQNACDCLAYLAVEGPVHRDAELAL
jgi:hypothetical protein